MVPPTQLLSYRSTKPRLRVLDLGEGTETPSKLLDRAGAVDRVLARQGWLAVHAGGLWWLHPDLDRPARKLGLYGGLVMGLDPSCIWFEDAGGGWVLYDGVADELRTRVDLGFMVAVLAETPEGLVVWDVADQARRVIEREPPHRTVLEIGHGMFMAAAGSRTVWSDAGSRLRIDDHQTGSAVEVHDARVLRWAHASEGSRAVSPNGRTLVLAGLGVFGPVPLDLSGKNRVAQKANDTVVAFIDLVSGAIDIVGDRFDSPSAPVWLADGEHIAFATPRSINLVEVSTRQAQVVPGEWTRPPHPRVDLALAGAATHTNHR